MRVGLVQLCSTDDPEANLPEIRAAVHAAAEQGARLVATPEVTNCVSSDRAHQERVLKHEDADPVLDELRGLARTLEVAVLVGSLALRTEDPDGRFANRSFLIGPDGRIRARYDKVHMFDVEVSPTERYRESAGYRPGDRAVVGEVSGVPIGMSICYDLRFPALYRRLAQAGALVLAVPSAFSPTTGAAHWEPLLRARAIETGCFVIAPAQSGAHRATTGPPRRTYGHSLAVSPWGEVLIDLGEEPGVAVLDLDLAEVATARRRIPSLGADREFFGP